jgi:hypothetical protein
VDIVNAPGASTQRKVNLITVCNKDTDFVNVTIRLNDNGTTYSYLASMALPPSCTLQFTDTDGWSVMDNGGNTVFFTGGLVDVQSYTSNGTWTKPTGATYVQVDAVGGGGGGSGQQVDCLPCCQQAQYLGSGGGGGSHLQFLFLASSLPASVPALVGAGGSGWVQQGGSGGSSVFAGLSAPGGYGGSSLVNGTGGYGGGGTAYDGYNGVVTANYMGGGQGGNYSNPGVGTAGGGSMFSGGGGGGGGSTGGGAGGGTGGAMTATSGGGAAANVAGTAGSTLQCGTGGGGSSGSTPGAGGAVGGGGGGSNSATCANGGRGQIWVVSW